MIKKITLFIYEIFDSFKVYVVELLIAILINYKKELLFLSTVLISIVRFFKNLYNYLVYPSYLYIARSNLRVYICVNELVFLLPETKYIGNKCYFLIGGSWISEDSKLLNNLGDSSTIGILNSGKLKQSRDMFKSKLLYSTENWIEVSVVSNNSIKITKLLIINNINRDYFKQYISKMTDGVVYKKPIYEPISFFKKLILFYFSLISRIDLNSRSFTISKRYSFELYSSLRISLLTKGSYVDNKLKLELAYSLINLIKRFIIGLFLSIILLFTMFFLRDLPINKFLFSIGSVMAIIYLLLSGFVFFIKKYKYGKYTTAMHRFWRRSFSIFWSLEGFLFIIFAYLTVFSNQEPFFMYDNIQLFKDYVYSWRYFISENLLVIVIISIIYYNLIRKKDLSFAKSGVFILLSSILYLNLTYLEFYQFYYTVSFYNPVLWMFDYDSNKWLIDYETSQTKRTRVLLHFITICLVAKFWHFIFIAVFWLFSVTRWIQLDNVSYQLLGSNLQNSIILYLLNWVLMFPWIKFSFRKFTYRHYKWLYVNFRSNGIRVFFYDFNNYISLLLSNLNINLFKFNINLSWLYLPIIGYDSLLSDISSVKLV